MSPAEGETGAVPRGGALLSATAALAILGGLLSIASALLVTVSVTRRWLGVGAVPGDFELVQIATAVSVFCFLPLTQARRGNIMVDTFTMRLPPAVNRGIDALWDFLYAAIMALLAWCLAAGATEALENGLNSMMLGLPLGPVFVVCAALVVVLASTAAVTGWQILKGRP